MRGAGGRISHRWVNVRCRYWGSGEPEGVLNSVSENTNIGYPSDSGWGTVLPGQSRSLQLRYRLRNLRSRYPIHRRRSAYRRYTRPKPFVVGVSGQSIVTDLTVKLVGSIVAVRRVIAVSAPQGVIAVIANHAAQRQGQIGLRHRYHVIQMRILPDLLPPSPRPWSVREHHKCP